MSKQIDKESTESQSSRDIILSRYQNVKNLLVTKNKIPSISLAPRPIEKSHPLKTESNQNDPPDEDDSRLNELILLCSQIQNKIKEKIAPRTTFIYNVLEKPPINLCYFEASIKSFYAASKKNISLLIINEKTNVVKYQCLQKPKVIGFYCEMSSKVFTVVHKIYQIIEFKEEKKAIKEPLDDKMIKKNHNVKATIEIQDSSTINIRNEPKAVKKQSSGNESIHSVSPVIENPINSLRNKSPIPKITPTNIDNKYSTYDNRLDQSILSSNNASFINTDSVVSFDQFMSNDKGKKNNYSLIASNQKLTKQAQLLQFKQKAREKELLMMRRKRSVIKIQSLYRGYKQRKKFAPLWERHKRKMKLEKLRIIAGRIKALFAPYIILKALRYWVSYRREEKQKLLILFQEYSALFIQKIWRGYKIRSQFSKVLQLRYWAKLSILSLLKGWKTRKVLQCKELKHLKTGIQDLINLQTELSQPEQNQSLYMQVTSQIPIMKGKFIKDFYRIYRLGTWNRSFNKPSVQNSVYEPSFHHDNSTFLNLSPIKSREDVPVKPLAFNIEDAEVVDIENSKKKFTNFLRRGQNTKYNPKPIAVQPKPPPSEDDNQIKVPNEFSDSEISSPKEQIPIKKGKIGRYSEDSEEIDDVQIENINKEQSKPIHNFLKRKSQSYKPTKLEWKAKTRVNCWGETITPEPKPKPKSKKKAKQVPKINKISQINQISFNRVQELENIFSQLSIKHIDVNEHFGEPSRTQIDSSIPQFLPDSFFITQFTDDMYQETFEALQAHYLILCNEEDMQ